MRVVLIIFVSIVCLHTYGQSSSHAAFLQQKTTIDSLTELIDTNREFMEERIVGGDSIYGGYNGSYLYNPEDRLICKLECAFLSSAFVP